MRLTFWKFDSVSKLNTEDLLLPREDADDAEEDAKDALDAEEDRRTAGWGDLDRVFRPLLPPLRL